MAKKNNNATSQNTDAVGATRRRSGSRRADPPQTAAAPVDMAGVSGTEPLETASDRARRTAVADDGPSYDEIAEAAYLRYLSRGGSHGRDFDDWIEAERDLAARRR
jgi:hypothetical protein